MRRWAPGPKLTPKIILEGTRLTHKTDLAFALNEHPRIVGPRKYAYHSPLISGEWCAFTPFPWGRGLINFAADEEARALETYAAWAHLFELMPYYSWIVDRFHLSTRACQRQERGVDDDFGWLEDRLAPLGFHMVLCVATPGDLRGGPRGAIEGVRQAEPVRRPRARSCAEQELLRELARQSKLPVLELDIADDDIAGACDRVADWMTETGGLWAPGVEAGEPA